MAGIVKRGEDDWVWQGNVIACNKSQAEKLINDYTDKRFGYWYTGMIAPGQKCHTRTKEKIGVYPM